MSLRLIPEGATVTRTYLRIPGHYGIGPEFPNTAEGWAAAVKAARADKAARVAVLTERQGDWSTPSEIDEIASRLVRVDLRWTIRHPEGGSTDTVMESYTDVDSLVARPGRTVLT